MYCLSGTMPEKEREATRRKGKPNLLESTLMKNKRCTRNQKTRAYLDEMLKDAKPGTILFSNDISIALSTKFRSVSKREVGTMLRERDDVRLQHKDQCGVWVVV